MTTDGQAEHSADLGGGQIVVIPVSLFRVHYQVAQGRPYSRLEQRVLQEIGERGHNASLSSLRRTFQVHERLLVEAVVTLASAGWVAVVSGPEATFALTSEGQQASISGKDPVTVTVGRPAPRIIVLDRTAGQLTRRGEARTITPEDARPHYFAQTPVRITNNTLDDSQVQKLLPRSTGEWVRSIGPTVLATHRRYLPVRAKVDETIVNGLPQGWYQALAPLVLEAARRWNADRDSVIVDLGDLPTPASAVVATRIPGPVQVPDCSGTDIPARRVTVTAEASLSEGAAATGAVPTEVATVAAVVQNDGVHVRVTATSTSGEAVGASSEASSAGQANPMMLARRVVQSAAVAPTRRERTAAPDLSWVARTPSPSIDSIDGTEYVVLNQVLAGSTIHSRRLEDAFQVAERQVFVASSALTVAGLEAVLPDIGAAVGRGVRVDLTYGKLDGALTAQEVVDILNRAGYTAAGSRGRDLLRCGRRPTGSGANLVLHDRASDRLEVVVGDHPWLGTSELHTGAREHPCSVDLTGDAFLGSIAQAAAALLTAAANALAAERWRHIAEDCRDRAVIEATRGGEQIAERLRAELIVDDEHLAVESAVENLLLVGGEPGRQGYHMRGVSVLFRGQDAATAREEVDKASARAGVVTS